MHRDLPAAVAGDPEDLVDQPRDLDLEVVLALARGPGGVQAEEERPGRPVVDLAHDDPAQEVQVVDGVGAGPVLPHEPDVLGPDDERHRRPRRGQIGGGGGVHGFHRLAPPADLDAVRRGLDHGPLDHVSHPEETRDRLVGGAGEQLGLRPRLDEAAPLVEHEPVAQLVGLGKIVGHEDDGPTPFAEERAQLPAELAAEGRVERGERLVEEQHLGVGREGPAERDALLLTSRQLAGPAARQGRQLEPIEDRGRPARSLGLCPAAEPEPDVLRHGQMREEGVALEHVAEPPRLGDQMDAAGDVVEGPAVDDDPAGVGAHEAG